MAKSAVKNFTTQLYESTNSLLKRVSKLKKEADNLAFSIDKIEKDFIQQENLKRNQEKQAQDQLLINSHRTSYIMPDDEEHKERDDNEVKKPISENRIEKSQSAAKSSAANTQPMQRKETEKPRFEKKTFEKGTRDKQDSQLKKDFSTTDNRNRQNRKTDRLSFRNDGNQFAKDDEDDSKNKFKKKPAQSASKSKTIPSADFIASEKEKVSNYDPHKKSYERRNNDFENQKKNKRIKTNHTYIDDDEGAVRGRKLRTKKKASAQQLMTVEIDSAVMTGDSITVRDLSAKIGKQANEILKQLLIIGVMATINNELDYDTAALVSSELGVELQHKLEQSAEEKLHSFDVEDEEKDLVPRPPVITIMGHVDHGKTSLLDYIRKSHVTKGEAGGITQHIGAYMVKVRDKMITFLDTPGHEAFTSMRARGAQATDIAIIVVAANDGVMPQTVEAINHAKAADVPIIIAINKMDLEHANADRVKQELANYELISEEWGGDTIMVPISAHTGKGIDELLDMILLVAELHQYKANPNRNAKGIIIEAKLDKSRGPLATVLLKNGTLRIGDSIVAGTSSGNVRAMVNDLGENVTEAGPSMPVEISGFDEVPEAGDEMMVVEDNRLGKTVIAERKDREKALRQSAGNKVTLENMFSQIEQGKQVKLNLIIKADVQGSVEAVKQALEKLSNDDVKVRVLHSAVGAVTNDDVNLASAFNAIIIGFNIRPNATATELATKEGVDIRLYRVIYKAIEDVELAMKGMLEPEYEEVILGHADVRDTFRISGIGTIAGAYVTDGKVQRHSNVRLLRDNIVVFDGKLSSLKRFKDDAKEVATNFECGISLEGFNDIKIGDIIECYIEQEIER